MGLLGPEAVLGDGSPLLPRRRGCHYMGMPAPAYYTRAMLRDIPEDGNRYELVRGELLVTPAPRLWHEIVTQRIEHTLTAYVQNAGLPFHVFGSRSEVSWGDDDTEVQPDTFVVPIAQARTLKWEQLTDLFLVVEVLSPSTSRHDRFTKRAEYQRRGVPLYWIVDSISGRWRCGRRRTISRPSSGSDSSGVRREPPPRSRWSWRRCFGRSRLRGWKCRSALISPGPHRMLRDGTPHDPIRPPGRSAPSVGRGAYGVPDLMATIRPSVGLTFDDVLLVPRHSTVHPARCPDHLPLHPLDPPQRPARLRRHGHRHRVRNGDRHGAGGRHRGAAQEHVRSSGRPPRWTGSSAARAG